MLTPPRVAHGAARDAPNVRLALAEEEALGQALTLAWQNIEQQTGDLRKKKK
jgi:hypothetical protein